MKSIEIDTDQTMRDIADVIKEKVGSDYGFAVLVFPFKDGEKVAHYISNARRGDMIKALREKADILEGKLDIQNVESGSCICKGFYQPLHCPVHGKWRKQ